jgi:hypothetical protein
VRTVIEPFSRRVTIFSTWGITMAALSLDQAARLTELGKTTITRAIKCSWLSARRKKDGIYEVDARVREVTVAVAALYRMMSERAARTGPFAVAPQGPDRPSSLGEI